MSVPDGILLKNLRKVYPGPVVAVEDLSFAVGRGEILGFLGSNGAGKTTTLKMLCGLLTPSAGTATVAGYDVVREPKRVRSAVGYMAQGFGLYPDLTVRENLDYFAGLYGITGAARRTRVSLLVDRLALAAYVDRRGGHLSGGTARRLSLAAALLHDPPVLFLDEPTAGVDPVQRSELWGLLYEIAEGGKTLVVTTHYMDEADRCRRVALMSAGRMPALGTPAELKRTLPPVWRVQAADLIAAERALAGHAVCRAYGDSVRAVGRCGEDSPARLEAALTDRGVTGCRVSAVEPTLEDVFLHHTRSCE
jgi:ABC-2 type transport system ATP-binding protein